MIDFAKSLLLVFNPGIVMMIADSAAERSIEKLVAGQLAVVVLEEAYIIAAVVLFGYVLGVRASRKRPGITWADIVTCVAVMTAMRLSRRP